MKLLQDILLTLKEGVIQKVCVALNWTVVAVELDNQIRCGLAATMTGSHEHSGKPQVPEAGSLIGKSTSALLASLNDDNSPRKSLAMATLNALIPHQPAAWLNGNAVDIISQQGEGKLVALVGHFPFVEILRSRLERVIVIDQNPLEGDFSPDATPEFLPQADFIAMTSMTLLNGTFEELMNYRNPNASVMLLGPSTPLSPVLFDHGVNWLSGSIVEDYEAVFQTASQGGNFRQVRKAGVRLVNLHRKSRNKFN